jgi:hypothetical protein
MVQSGERLDIRVYKFILYSEKLVSKALTVL